MRQPVGDAGAIVTINKITPVYVSFSVPQQNLDLIQSFQAKGALKTQVWLPTEGPTVKPHEGELTFLDNTVANDTGTIKLRAGLRLLVGGSSWGTPRVAGKLFGLDAAAFRQDVVSEPPAIH